MAINDPKQTSVWSGYQPVFAERKYTTFEVVIADTEAYSQTFNFINLRSFAIYIPAGFTGAKISFVGSHADTDDPALMADCYTGHGGEITIDVVAGAWVCPKDDDIHGLHNMKYLKVRAGTSAAPVAQVADVTLRFMCLG